MQLFNSYNVKCSVGLTLHIRKCFCTINSGWRYKRLYWWKWTVCFDVFLIWIKMWPWWCVSGLQNYWSNVKHHDNVVVSLFTTGENVPLLGIEKNTWEKGNTKKKKYERSTVVHFTHWKINPWQKLYPPNEHNCLYSSHAVILSISWLCFTIKFATLLALLETCLREHDAMTLKFQIFVQTNSRKLDG